MSKTDKIPALMEFSYSITSSILSKVYMFNEKNYYVKSNLGMYIEFAKQGG